MKSRQAVFALGLAIATAGLANAAPCTGYPNGAGCHRGARTNTRALQVLQSLAKVQREGGEDALAAGRLESAIRSAWRAYLAGGSDDAAARVETELARAQELLARRPAK